MALRFFFIPVSDSNASEQELNGFLASHKILSMERHLIDQGSNSFWTICVDYSNSVSADSTRNQNLSRNRVDYKAMTPSPVGTAGDVKRQFCVLNSLPVTRPGA